jgi:L-ascorbate metabolism protein UlaG (beta-lactamase superfamily)
VPLKTILMTFSIVLALVANSSIAHDQIQHIRSATFKLEYAGTTFLIDPLLAKKGAYPGFEGTFRSELNNPTVELPMPLEEVVADVDAVVVTHVHLDHWDDVAQEILTKNIPLFVQNEADAAVVRSQGFSNVRILHEEQTKFRGLYLSKTAGQHGSDVLFEIPDLAAKLGVVMGVVFEAPERKTVYVAGDTIWCEGVDEALKKHDPDVIVLNTGHAIVTGLEEYPIIMSKEDTLRATMAAPNAIVVAVHMDAINHCALSRKELREYVKEKGIEDRVLIPSDGEVLKF